MTQIDNSKIFLGGTFGDVTVKVAANTTLRMGTVLGLNSDGDIVAFSSDNDKAATESEPAFVGEPSYILANDIVNSGNSAATYPLSRVLEEGEVNAAKVIFVKDADKNAAYLTALKNNGIILKNVSELA